MLHTKGVQEQLTGVLLVVVSYRVCVVLFERKCEGPCGSTEAPSVLLVLYLLVLSEHSNHECISTIYF